MKTESKLATAIKYINNVITILLSVIVWILAYADQVKPLVDLVSPEMAAKWPVIIPAILGVRAILAMIGDLLDDGKINQSFKVLLLCFGGIFVFSMLPDAVDIYERQQPENAREAALLLEEIARGINSATVKLP